VFARSGETPPDVICSRWAYCTETGWPMRCWWSARFVTGRGHGSVQIQEARQVKLPKWLGSLLGVTAMPIGVRPWPFVVNSLFFAAIPCVGWLSVVGLRRVRRGRAGRCVGCGYDMAGLPKDNPCPECGRAS
jgi:hypothetical protein